MVKRRSLRYCKKLSGLFSDPILRFHLMRINGIEYLGLFYYAFLLLSTSTNAQIQDCQILTDWLPDIFSAECCNIAGDDTESDYSQVVCDTTTNRIILV